MLILQLAEEKGGKGHYLFLIRMKLENHTHHLTLHSTGQTFSHVGYLAANQSLEV